MELISLIMGIIGNAVSLMVYASPLPTFWRIIRKRTTEEFSAVPYLTCLFSLIMSIYYGVLDPKGLFIVTISTIGAALEMFYVTVYMVLASKPQRLSAVRLFSLGSLIFTVVFIGTLLGARGDKRLHIVGSLSCINSVCMFAAPLGVMRQVIRTKSVEYMPLFLSLSLFLCGGIWSGYALILRDVFVGAPNAIGCFLGAVQLTIYVIYYKRTPDRLPEAAKSVEMKTRAEESSFKLQEMKKKWPGDQAV